MPCLMSMTAQVDGKYNSKNSRLGGRGAKEVWRGKVVMGNSNRCMDSSNYNKEEK